MEQHEQHEGHGPGTLNPDAETNGGGPHDPRLEAVKSVAEGSKDEWDLKDATAWFMSEQDAGVKATKVIEVDVGAAEERFVRWRVEAISRDRIRQIRNLSKVRRGRGMGDEINDTKANLMIAAEGTVDPDLRSIAGQVGAPDVAVVLEKRMSHKPGLIDQIANAVLEVSGYDDEDVRDVAAVRGS
jgi:hypothetical protein